MGVIELKAGTRTRSIRAVENCSLAAMKLSDLKIICD